MDLSKESLWGPGSIGEWRAVMFGGVCVNVYFTTCDCKSPLGNMRSNHPKSVFKTLNAVSVLDRLRKDNEESDTTQEITTAIQACRHHCLFL